MSQTGVTVGLDIGATLIKVVVAQTDGQHFNVIATGNAPSRGIRNGIIVDINETASAIRQAIDYAREKANIEIQEVVVGLPANQLEISNADGLVSIENQNKRITYNDVANVTEQALAGLSNNGKEVIELVPSDFVVDGFDGVKDPNDMIGVRLELRGLAYLGPSKMIDNIRMAVQKAGLRVKEFVLAPLVMGETILNDGEQDFGSVLIDLGGGQTTVSVIHDHQLKFTFVDPEGGDNVTRDISTVLGISYNDAENIKRDHGFATPSQASANQTFFIEVVGENEAQITNEEYLAEIIAARLGQIYDRVIERLKFIGAMDLPGGFIITGGNSALPGSLAFAKERLGDNVHMSVPDQIGLRHPAYSRALSYVLFNSSETQLQEVVKRVLMAQFDEEGASHVAPYHQVSGADEAIETQIDEEDEIYVDEQAGGGLLNRWRTRITNLFKEEDDEKK